MGKLVSYALLAQALLSTTIAAVQMTVTCGQKEIIGLYFVGMYDELSEFEQLKEVITPDRSTVTHSIKKDHAFVMRGGDMNFRVKVIVRENPHQDEGRPYVITI